MIAEILLDTGSDRPPLAYVPGIDGSGRLLLGAEERLSASFRLLCLRYRHDPEADLVGDGYPELAASLVDALRARGVARALVLAESFGVSVALRAALDRPDVVAGLALVNGFAHYPARLRLALSSRLAPLVPRSLFTLGRSLFAPLSLLAPRRDDEALRAFRALPGSWFDAGYRRRLAMVGRVDLRPELPRIARPVAIYASDHDRIVPSRSCAEVMAAGLPDATLEVLPRAGHLVLPLAEEPWVERLGRLAERAELLGTATRGTSRAS